MEIPPKTLNPEKQTRSTGIQRMKREPKNLIDIHDRRSGIEGENVDGRVYGIRLNSQVCFRCPRIELTLYRFPAPYIDPVSYTLIVTLCISCTAHAGLLCCRVCVRPAIDKSSGAGPAKSTPPITGRVVATRLAKTRQLMQEEV